MMSAQAPLRILVMAGGTGGHVFPALAVANELRSRGVEVSWLGTRQGQEAEWVARHNIPIDFIEVAGLRGKGALSWLLAPFRLLVALLQSWKVLRRRHPAAVLGMGGFVAGPGGVAAWLMRCPLLIHEQNARAGLTNRLLKPLASKVMEAFPRTFEANHNKVMQTGNPLRRDFLKQTDRTSHQGPLRLLVVGGSLGAAHFNAVVPEALAGMNPASRPEVWHQAGKRNIDAAQAAYLQQDVEARVEPFIEDMAAAYQWADVVLCRAGAMTVSELAAAGAASILVPYPHAVDDHQTANARYLSDQSAAILLPQTQMTASRLAQLLGELSPDALRRMAEASQRLAMPDATLKVADACLAVAKRAAHG